MVMTATVIEGSVASVQMTGQLPADAPPIKPAAALAESKQSGEPVAIPAPGSGPEVTLPTNPSGPKGLWARLRGRWGKTE